MGSTEKHNSNGKSFWQPTYQHVATIGKPGGPSGDGFDRGRRVCHQLTGSAALAESRTDVTNDNNAAPMRKIRRSRKRRRRPATIPASLADLERHSVLKPKELV